METYLNYMHDCVHAWARSHIFLPCNLISIVCWQRGLHFSMTPYSRAIQRTEQQPFTLYLALLPGELLAAVNHVFCMSLGHCRKEAPTREGARAGLTIRRPR